MQTRLRVKKSVVGVLPEKRIPHPTVSPAEEVGPNFTPAPSQPRNILPSSV
jgi:hypothetical protein